MIIIFFLGETIASVCVPCVLSVVVVSLRSPRSRWSWLQLVREVSITASNIMFVCLRPFHGSSETGMPAVGSNAERASQARANDGQARKKEAKQPLGNISLAVLNLSQIITTKKKKVSITP